MGDLIGLDFKAAEIIWKYAGFTLNNNEFRDLMLFSRTVVFEKQKKG